MKRVVAYLMALVMIVGCITGFAEDLSRKDIATTLAGHLKSLLEIMKTIYDYFPDQFDDGYVLATYHYYNAYKEMKNAELAEIANDSSGLSIEGLKMLEASDNLIDSDIREAFNKWLKGEETGTDFGKLLMNLVDIIISDDEATTDINGNSSGIP